MVAFLLIFLSLYGALNFCVFWKVRQAFPQMGWWLLAPGAFLLLMVAGPVLVQLLARWGLTGAARALAVVAYPWMALVMWFAFLALLLALWNLAARGAESFSPRASAFVMGPRVQLLALGCAVALLGLWGLGEARSVRLERLTVGTARLPAGSPPVTIAVIADLHMSLLASSGRLERALALVGEARPDMVVSVGDLIDAPLPENGHLAALLAAVRPPLGKYAIFGNHEFYAGPEVSDRFLNSAGFRVLHGEAAMAGPLLVAGVDDPAEARAGASHHPDEGAILPKGDERPFTVLLKHRPQLSAASSGRFDLQVSGHTHGGQVFPFGLLVRLMFARIKGDYALDGGARLYVSRGTGTWGPPLRLLARPEVTLITIKPLQTGS